MSQLDPSMAALSLARNFMQPPLSPEDQEAGALQASYKVRHGAQQSARPAQGSSALLAQHFQQQQAVHQQNLQQQQQQPQAAPQVSAPRNAAQPSAAPREQDYNPAGVTLGQQNDGSRNVELIRGGQSEVQHFDAQGDNQGVLRPNSVTPHLQDMLSGVSPEHAKALSAYAQAGATPQQLMNARHQLEGTGGKAVAKPQTFDQANQQQLFQYKDAERIVAHLEKKGADNFNGGGFNASLLSPEEQQRYQHAHETLNTVGQQLANWGKAPGQQATPPHVPTGFADSILHGDAAQALGKELPGLLKQQAAQQASPQQQDNSNIPRPPKPGTALSAQLAAQMLQAAGGDKDKARKLAKDAGWSF